MTLRRKHGGHETEPQETAERAAQAEAGAELIEKALLEEALAQRDSANDQMLRVMAEFQNFKRRTEQDRISTLQTATQDLVVKLLPVLDNFERAIESLDAGAPIESLIDGIRAVDKQFRGVLESVRVSKIASTGQPFDPEIHEAIATVESDEHPEDTVVGEVESGYRMADKVIRPARVRVAKRP